MQRRLVDDRAADDGCPVAVVGEAQPVEPAGPSGIEVPLDANLVTPRLTAIVRRSARLSHALPSGFPWHRPRRRDRRAWCDANVDAEVGTAHPHLWGLRWGYLDRPAVRAKAEMPVRDYPKPPLRVVYAS